MLIKQADDKTSDLKTLKSLLNHPAANTETKKMIEQEIRNISSGNKGEADAAYEIDFHYGPSKNWAIIHDLRLAHQGRIAQIDHLLVNRCLEVWVFESKRFSDGIGINEQGECVMFWNGKPIGIGSPHEQNAKHIAVIKALCDDATVLLPKRLGFPIKPSFNSLVIVSKNARISRPKSKGWWDDGIVKADQVKMKVDKAYDDNKNILLAAKIVASETLEDFARGLTALHLPASFDWHAKFGLPHEMAVPFATCQAETTQPEPESKPESKKPEPVCFSCGKAVEYKVVTFCVRFNKPRFGGNIYCQDCQKRIPKPA